VIDDRLMKITHVIRGEEWLSSTAHHVLLYRFFGWESEMPEFSHLPLILKPSGNGKLSKRDGAQFGFPVFPLDWKDEKTGDLFLGFREQGFLPEALLNFMALLGWNSGTEKEIFSLDELIQYFSKDKIGKSSSRFDYDKAKWFNQQYIQNTEDTILAKYVIQDAAKQDQKLTDEQAISIIKLYKDRSIFLTDFFKQGKYLISDIAEVDQDFKSKKWKQEWTDSYLELANTIEQSEEFTKEKLEEILKAFMAKYTYKMGEVLPSLRVMMSGIPMGPDIYAMILTLSKAVFVKRIRENIIKLNK
jgi:glutamyl-tRNA synthetase